MIYTHNKKEGLRLYFLRHGETDWNRRGLYQGHSDPPLNEEGRRQALKAAARLLRVTFAKVYTSDLRRARETTQIITSQLKAVEVRHLKGLRELDFGLWEGLSYAEVERNYPQEIRHIYGETETFQAPGGESVLALKKRVIKTWENILREIKGGTIMIVTHGGPIRVLWEHWLGGNMMTLWNIPFSHCAMGFASFNTIGGYPRLFIHRI